MTGDFTERNRQVFEKMSRTYKTDFGNVLKAIFNLVQDKRAWVSDTWIDTESGKGKEIRMLEYACGPGNVSLALAPFVTRVTGIDLSDGMIDEYNMNARDAGLSDTMVGLKADLLAESVPAEASGPEYFDFDFVVISMALHHFEKPELAVTRLGERLKEGGVMLIIDLVPEHEHSPGHGLQHEMPEAAETISKHGFSLEEMQKLYEDAGIATGFKYQVVEEPLVFNKNGKTFHKTIFIARGQKGGIH